MSFDFISTTAIIGVLIPIIAMLIGLTIALFAIHRNYKTRQLEHELRMAALQKGYDIPALPASHKPKPAYPFTWPFIFLGFGLALIFIYIFADGDTEALGFGLVIFFIGAGLFASRFYGVRKEEMSHAEQQVERNWIAPKTEAAAQPTTGESAAPNEEATS